MKYVVLRKQGRTDNPFVELVSARATSKDFEFPYTLDVREVADDREIDEVQRDPGNEDVFLSIPFTLIEPLHEFGEGAAPSEMWGLDAVSATASPFDGSGVSVAVLDTGIDSAHPAFADFTFPTNHLMDFTKDSEGVSGSAIDTHGHGTHVAGTLFGHDVDGHRIGVARGVERALIGKVFGLDGTASTEAIFNALNWALKERADIISMSLGINFPGAVSQLIERGFPSDIAASRALEAYQGNVRLFERLAMLVEARARDGRGAMLIAASGNASRRKENPQYTVAVGPPATADGFLAVGAIAPSGRPDAPYEVASFSNTGCLLAAPGVSIASAQLGGGLVTKNGTSMATPHVAGVAALWTQKLLKGSLMRPKGWTKDVQRALETHAASARGLSRRDVGLGIVQAPKD